MPGPALSPQKPTRTYFSVTRHEASVCRFRRQNTSTPSPSMPNTPNMAAWPWFAVSIVPTSK